MTQLEKAREGIITGEMRAAAVAESAKPAVLMREIAAGRAVIPANNLHKNLRPIVIGRAFSAKINANIGTSPNRASLKEELEKFRIAVKFGADAVMDLSTGGDIDRVRRAIIARATVPIGTVPIYQAAVDNDSIVDLTERDFLRGIEKHVEDGVDFITVHAGLTRSTLPLLKRRIIGVVSRGGAMLASWMLHNNSENPLYEAFDEILRMAYKRDVTLSLGDGLRPGSIADATDKAQIAELKNLGKLTKIAWKEDVQIIIEGPGHIPINEIERNIRLQEKYCHSAPFYVLGPLVTDAGAGYDHITAAIGSALAGYYGAAFLCYVSPKEHLGLPDVNDVKEGVIAARIAAHSADIARGLKRARKLDFEMSKARARFDWEKQFALSPDPQRAKKFNRAHHRAGEKACTMCGKYCAMKVYHDQH